MPERLVLCGEAPNRRPRHGSRLRLSLGGPDANVRLRLQDISRRLASDVPPLLTDLIEIAAYVHCADQAVSRGGEVRKGMGADWRREFHFVVPVRHPEKWSSPEIMRSLTAVLGFLSEDRFQFEFIKQRAPPPFQSYFDFGQKASDAFQATEVVLFSGGLDSLGGAIEELASGQARLALVSHSSSSKIQSRQALLAGELKSRFPGQVLHIPVLVTRQDTTGKTEETQRTRTFLFGALAVAVAHIFSRRRIRFYENGVVSLNLPIAGQVVGTQATRTTHPRALRDLSQFLALLLDDEMTVENPFCWKTKTEVAASVGQRGHADLVRHTVSCSHVYEMTTLQTHCGKCSQCLDRRFATLGAGLADADPQEMYAVQLFTEARDGTDRTMAEAYVRTALEYRRMTPAGFLGRFAGEVSRAALSFPDLTADEVVRAAFDLHKRHGASVHSVLANGVREQADVLAAGALPESCILRMAMGQHVREFDGAPIGPGGERDLYDASRDPRDFRQSMELRLALDAKSRRVLIQGVPPIHGSAGHSLVEALVANYQSDLNARRAPERFRYMPARKLANALSVEEPTLRRRVNRFRNSVAALFQEYCGLPLEQDAIIQSKSWQGYRINPAVRLVAESEIAPMRHDSAYKASRLLDSETLKSMA